jgi:excinuclease UvrABC nuclease subunit
VAVYEGWLSELRGSKVAVRVPQRGDKRELHETVTRNAKEEFTRHRLRRAADHNSRAAAASQTLGARFDARTHPTLLEPRTAGPAQAASAHLVRRCFPNLDLKGV